MDLWLTPPILVLIASTYFFRGTDPDYWWHLRTGEVIARSGIPTVDIFTTTSLGKPWITHEWLSQLLFYLIDRAGGYGLTVGVFALLGAMAFCLVSNTCRLWGASPMVAALFASLGASLSFIVAGTRPQMFTIVLLAFTALVCTGIDQHGFRKWMLWLPLVFVAWVNLHGGYVIGLALLWLAVIGEYAAVSPERWRAVPRTAFMLAVVCTLATLCSPLFISAWTYPFTYAGSGNASMRFVHEWQSPDFHDPGFVFFGAAMLLLTIVGVWGTPLSVTQVLWSSAFAILAMRSGRHVPLFGVVVAPLLAARISSCLTAARVRIPTFHPKVISVVLWLMVPLLWFGALQQRASGRLALQTGPVADDRGYPRAGAEYLLTHETPGNLFNEYAWGGYLIYKLYPKRLVFIDGRADVHGDATLEAYAGVTAIGPRWNETLEQFGIGTALLRKGSPAAVLLASSGRWRTVFEGPVEVILQR